MPGAKTRTKPVRVRSFDPGLQTHVLAGIGFSFECSCGERGAIRNSWNAAAQDGREHTAAHGQAHVERVADAIRDANSNDSDGAGAAA